MERHFEKDINEMKERLRMRGFIIPETESDGLEDDADATESFDDDETEG